MEQGAVHCSKPQWLSKEFYQLLINSKYPEATVKKVISSHPNSGGIEIIYIFHSLVELLTPFGTEIKTYQVKLPNMGLFSPRCMEKAPIMSLDTEVRVLTKFVPVMERILDNIAPGKYEPLTSALIDSGRDSLIYNIIEDDHHSNFTVLANDKGVDLKHCMSFMRFLAIFHASSISALNEMPWDDLASPLLPDTDAWELSEDVIKASLAGVIAQLEMWEDGQAWSDKIRKLSAGLTDRYADAHRRQPERFRVLVHGSPSGERVLFRDDPEKPGCCVRLRGFEFSRVGSFADDILHFIYRAASDDVLESHTDILAEEYRTAFNEASELLGLQHERLSPEDVRTELHAQRAVALVMAFHELPHVRTPDYLDEGTASETYEAVYKCPEYTKLLRILLPLFDARGWLDGFDDTSTEDQVPGSSLPTT